MSNSTVPVVIIPVTTTILQPPVVSAVVPATTSPVPVAPASPNAPVATAVVPVVSTSIAFVTAPPTTQTRNAIISSAVIVTPTSINGVVVIITTQVQTTFRSTPSSASPLSSATTTAPDPTSTAPAAAAAGLSQGAVIGIAVVVPVVVVALLILAGLFLWRKRKQRRDVEELRRKEVEEYGYNPNNDPTFPAGVGAAGAAGDEGSEMREADGAGYRGWGNTNTSRKASTTLASSGAGGTAGVSRSDSGGRGWNSQPSPTQDLTHHSDAQSGDPLVSRPISRDLETVGALGAAPTASNNRPGDGVNRGASNASSAYSTGHLSDTSTEGPPPSGLASPQYYNEYLDQDPNAYAPPPVIRDVSARRNTKIESPATFPQPANTGISQNF